MNLPAILSVTLLILLSTVGTHAQDDATPEPDPLPEDIVALFDYDASAPLDLHETGSETRDGITVRDVTYASPVNGEPIAAYLVEPRGNGASAPRPGILWVHWYEPSSPTSNRTQYLGEAVTLAKQGVVSLLPATMWSEPSWFNRGRALATDFQDSVDQVINLRRALDVLLAQPGIDPDRIAYVGHDFGAMYGSVLAGADRRPRAYVLIAGTPDFSNWFLLGQSQLPPVDREAFIAEMAPLAPSAFVAHAAPAPVYFQFGNYDEYVPYDVATAYFDAASEPKQISRYLAGHDMAQAQIEADRLDFLRAQLGLS